MTDYSYLNVVINNDGDSPIHAKYDSTRQIPILYDIENYQLAVTRLKIPSALVPLDVFQDDTYHIGFTINGNANLLTRTLTYDTPSNTETQYPMSRYIYYYGQMIDSINNALIDLWLTALGDPTYVPLLAGFTNNDAPYLRISKSRTGYLELVLPCQPASVDSCPFSQAEINIVMNDKLFYYLSGFKSTNKSVGWGGNSLYTERLLIETRAENLEVQDIYNAGVMKDKAVVQQEFPTLFYFQALTRVFVTTDMPVNQEIIVSRGDGGRPSSLAVLTDWEISQTEQNLRENIIYTPQSEFRYVNFNNSGPLYRLDLKFYFQLRDLSVHPLLIPTGQNEVVAKILFKRRPNSSLLTY